MSTTCKEDVDKVNWSHLYIMHYLDGNLTTINLICDYFTIASTDINIRTKVIYRACLWHVGHFDPMANAIKISIVIRIFAKRYLKGSSRLIIEHFSVLVRGGSRGGAPGARAPPPDHQK